MGCVPPPAYSLAAARAAERDVTAGGDDAAGQGQGSRPLRLLLQLPLREVNQRPMLLLLS